MGYYTPKGTKLDDFEDLLTVTRTKSWAIIDKSNSEKVVRVEIRELK